MQQDRDAACHIVGATSPGNPPAVTVRTAKTVQFSSRTIQKPNALHPGGPNPDSHLSTRRFCQVWLDPLVPISSYVFRVFLLKVTFSYPTANRKILTFLRQYSFQINWPPLWLKTRETRSLPHPEHYSQWRINNCYSFITGNLGVDWMQTIIDEVLAVFQSKRDCDTLPARYRKWASTER